MSIYLVKLSIIEQLPVFQFQATNQIILDSLFYCRKRKGIKLYGYLIWLNAVYLVIKCQNHLWKLLRDFKKQNSRMISNYLINYKELAAAEWLLSTMYEAGDNIKKVIYFQFWTYENEIREIHSLNQLEKILREIHSIPEREGIVIKSQYWRYSSSLAYLIRRGEISINLKDQQIMECLDEIDSISEGDWCVKNRDDESNSRDLGGSES